MKSKKTYIILLLLLGGLIYGGQKLLNQSDSTSTSTTESTTQKVQRGTISQAVEASGYVETANFLTVTTSVNGIVKQVFVKEGDTVIKGQKIMEITLNSDGEESLSSAWAAYLSAKSSLQSAKDGLYAKESALINAEEAFDTEKERNSYQTHDERTAYKLAENTYLTAKSNYDMQQDEIQKAEASLNKAWLSYQAQSPTVVAPDSGTIANIVVVEGMDISNSLSERTSASVASIKKEGTPIVSLSVNELDINDVDVGQRVNIELNSVEDKVFTGEVVGIDKIGSVASNITSYTVIVKFDEASDLALPNMGADASIIISQKEDVLYVPTSAITSKQNKTYVTVMDNGQEKQQEVEVGISDGKNTEIVSGLEEGAEIVVGALPTSGFTEAQSQSNNVRFPGMTGGFR